MNLAVVTVCLALTLPVIGVFASWAGVDAAAATVLEHLARTVLPGYAATSLALVVAVAVGVSALGGATAIAVAMFEFPGRRVYEWALLLPMAVPAYVLAYAYTDFLQFSGPLQTLLRERFGLTGALWPDVRSLGGAAALFVLCLYPYVYLLTRAALAERGVLLLDAARMLGAGPLRRLHEVAMPLARPAIAAGVALAAMETLADYGVGAYFGLTTFTTGIYKAWLVMNDGAAAAQLSSILLVLVAIAIWVERRARRRMRFAASRPSSGPGAEGARIVLEGVAAHAMSVLCAVPVALGFAIPALLLLAMLWQQGGGAESAIPLARFAQWAWTSLRLAGVAALVAALVALSVAFALRTSAAGSGGRRVLGVAARMVSLGYALPGAVIAIGILVPLGWLQARWPQVGLSALVTGTAVGIVYAYLVRYTAVALESIEAGYARVPVAFDEGARMLGHGRGSILARVHLPLLQRSALAASLLVFVDVMKELPATLVLRPFDSDTLAVVAYQFARDERLAEAALPSLAIVLVGLMPVIVLSTAMRRRL